MTALKTIAGRIPLARSTYCLGLRINKILRDVWAEPARFDQLYLERNDPWSYAESEEEQRRFAIAGEMLDAVRQGRQFESVFEIGCGEGKVSVEYLAPRSCTLMAVDFSTVALERARARASENNHHIQTKIWKLQSDSAPGQFELVVAMDMIEYLSHPLDLRRARAKIMDCLKPGGYLLITVRYSAGYEDFWWSKLLLAGGKHIVGLFERSANIRILSKAVTPHHYIALYQKMARDFQPPAIDPTRR
jgi:2-polyprenyl-3-methyl-5-hydroxy-6-metoxy-1,4-benzoquinol methylase